MLRPLPRFRLVQMDDWCAPQERLGLLPAAQEHVLAQEDGKDRCLNAVRATIPGLRFGRTSSRKRSAYRDDVGFFQAVRVALSKRAAGEARPEEELDLRRSADHFPGCSPPKRVMDVFSAAGLEKPDISVLSDEFLAEVRDMPHRNLGRRASSKAAQRRGSQPSTQERCASPVLLPRCLRKHFAVTRTGRLRRRRSSRN